MKYLIIVTDPPYETENAITAFSFSRSLLFCNHKISSIFFYYQGVLNANKRILIERNSFNLVKEWENWAIDNSIILYLCIGSAYRQGLLSTKNKKYFENFFSTHFKYGFKLTGISSLIKQMKKSHRIVQF